MEENNQEVEVLTERPKNTFFYIIIVEAVTALIILTTVFIMKNFFKPSYNRFYKWYQQSFGSTTDIGEVLGEIGGGNDEV